MDPLIFEPYVRPQVWGSRRLAGLGKSLPEGTYGEAWEISAHPHHVSRVAEGPLQGALLSELWANRAADLLGADRTAPDRFPLLVKFLDCHEQLSVQVHPDDAMARQLLSDELGKTEAWVVLDAEPTARIYAGLHEGTTPEALRRHLATGTVADCLHSFVPRPGDCLMLSAGTVHAVGGGVLLAEVQQSSDATFRLFDWNRLGTDGRPRALHVEESLRSIDYGIGPTNPVRPQPLSGFGAGVMGERLAACRYFELERFRAEASFDQPYVDELSIWIVVDGAAELSSPGRGYRRTLTRGETVLVPASAGSLVWTPVGDIRPATLLGVCVP